MKINVTRSAVVEAPIEKVWELLRDFNSHRLWHPAVAESLMENDLDGDVVGGVRRFSLTDGGELREQLLHHSDCDHTLTYGILDASLPLVDYVATIRLRPVTDANHTLWHWQARFRAPGHRATELKNLVGRQIFEAGFTGLRKFLAGLAAPSSPRHTVIAQPTTTEAAGHPLPSRAVVLTAAGKPAQMSLQDSLVPPPSPRQVRLRQTAVGVNPIDLIHTQRNNPGLKLPLTPGLEGVGEIIDVGEQVVGLFAGDRVAYVSPTPGAYAEIHCVDADTCIPIPLDVSDSQASTLGKGVTAVLLLNHIFRANPGATILIPSVTSGLGHLLSQWANSMGLTVIGTVATIEQAKRSRNFGCDHPIKDTANSSITDDVLRLTNGRGVDFLIHSTCGVHRIEDAMACLAVCGHAAVIDHRTESPLLIDINLLKERSLTLSVPECSDYLKNRLNLQRIAHQFFAKIQSRTIVPVVETHPLGQAIEAHNRIEADASVGAVALIPGN